MASSAPIGRRGHSSPQVCRTPRTTCEARLNEDGPPLARRGGPTYEIEPALRQVHALVGPHARLLEVDAPFGALGGGTGLARVSALLPHDVTGLEGLHVNDDLFLDVNDRVYAADPAQPQTEEDESFIDPPRVSEPAHIVRSNPQQVVLLLEDDKRRMKTGFGRLVKRIRPIRRRCVRTFQRSGNVV